MSQCFDSRINSYVYCTSYSGAYIAVGTVIPIVIVLTIAILSLYLRHKRKRVTRAQQQIRMATVVPIYNADEQQQQTTYNYAYPPHYTSVISSPYDDKPPSYEQTVEHISETNNTSNDGPAILPITTTTASSTQPVDPIRAQH